MFYKKMDYEIHIGAVHAGSPYLDFQHSGLVFMLCTGFKDFKAEEIYEGDIVKRTCLAKSCDLEHIGVVEYSENWCMFCLNEKPGVPFNGYLPPLAYGDPMRGVVLGVEKLGNIYENPEILKGRVDKLPK